MHPAMRDLPPAAQAHMHDMSRQPKRVMDRLGRVSVAPAPLTAGADGRVRPMAGAHRYLSCLVEVGVDTL